MKPLDQFVELARTQSLEEFCEGCKEPVLVLLPAALWESTGFQTIAARGGPSGKEVLVGQIRKRRGSNAFASMITIGRTDNNDIIIKSPGVSKFHAFLQAQGEDFLITDGGSTYGTHVNGHKLAPKYEKVALADGDELRLGNEVRLTYHTPQGFYASLGTLKA